MFLSDSGFKKKVSIFTSNNDLTISDSRMFQKDEIAIASYRHNLKQRTLWFCNFHCEWVFQYFLILIVKHVVNLRLVKFRNINNYSQSETIITHERGTGVNKIMAFQKLKL